MKTKELIEMLQKLDQDAEVEFPLSVHTQVHPVFYAKDVYKVYKAWDGTNRIEINLPKGVTIAVRKTK